MKDLVASATSRIEFRQFRLEFVRIVDADNFKDLEQVKLPFLIIGAAMAHGLTVSDSIYVPDQDTLLNGYHRREPWRSGCSPIPRMPPIAQGRPDISIVKMRDALSALIGVEAEGTPAEAYCRRVVPHGLLWLYREIAGTEARARKK